MPLPAFRGHMVNGEAPSAGGAGTRSAADGAGVRGERRGVTGPRPRPGPPRRTPLAQFPDGPWASHDALVIDYEAPLVRTDAGQRILGSTHLPWLGDRTRAPGSAHVRLLSQVANPVALKLGPSADPAELAEVCALLDPDRTPGRLTLIARMGAERVTELLPPLVAAVRAGATGRSG